MIETLCSEQHWIGQQVTQSGHGTVIVLESRRSAEPGCSAVPNVASGSGRIYAASITAIDPNGPAPSPPGVRNAAT
eukprot:7051711-Lingulodinium_polyedra.AAC.1